MEKYYYSYSEFCKDAKALVGMVKEYKADAILAIARGGLTLGHYMGIGLDIRDVYAINSIHYDNTNKLDYIKIFNIPNLKEHKRVLIVDDIIDSGDTMAEILQILSQKYPDIEFKTVSIFYKPTAKVNPDFTLKEAKEWIDFFWEVDITQE